MASEPSYDLIRDQVPEYTRLHHEFMSTDPEYVAEDMAFGVAETVSRIMSLREMSRADLARAMNVSRGYVTRFLQAPPNMTLQTLATVGLALDVVPRVVFPVVISSHVLFPRPAQQAFPGMEAAPRVILAVAKEESPWTYLQNSGSTSSESVALLPTPSTVSKPPMKTFQKPSTATALSSEQFLAS